MTARKTKTPAAKSNSLLDFWNGLSPNLRERARAMNKICADADVSYQHVKGVMNRKRSLGADSAERFIKAAKAHGAIIALDDLIIPACSRR